MPFSCERARENAILLFEYAIGAADPGLALRQSLSERPFLKPRDDGRHIMIAVGKAAAAMMGQALAHSSERVEAMVVTNYENAPSTRDLPAFVQVFLAGHPLPDKNGLLAASAVIDRLQSARIEDVVIVLVSGGASALLPSPIPGITLDEKVAVNKILLESGLPIATVNLVRQNLSRLKGGGMAYLAHPAKVEARIISDVIGDDMRVIGGGPTGWPLGRSEEAKLLLEEAKIFDLMPVSVQAHLSGRSLHWVMATKTAAGVRNILIGSNAQSLAAMVRGARKMGYTVIEPEEPLDGDVRDAAKKILAAAKAASPDENIVMLWGGETTVRVKGKGKGGRNQELALHFACGAEDALSGRDWVLLSGGTDGIDGPTDAAGALVDKHTLARIAAAGCDLEARLADNDAYHALQAVGDLLITGATQTNVGDVQILLLGARPSQG